MKSRGTWYDAALVYLRALDLPLDMSDAEVDARVRDAYPFGERRHWPYKAWLKAVKDWKRDRAKLRAFTSAGGAKP